MRSGQKFVHDEVVGSGAQARRDTPSIANTTLQPDAGGQIRIPNNTDYEGPIGASQCRPPEKQQGSKHDDASAAKLREHAILSFFLRAIDEC